MRQAMGGTPYLSREEICWTGFGASKPNMPHRTPIYPAPGPGSRWRRNLPEMVMALFCASREPLAMRTLLA